MATKAGIADWWELAACQSTDPELFFPVAAAGAGLADISRAKAICARCAIRRHCLDYALATGQPHGIWGGTTEGERRAIAAQRRLTQRVS
jgi:WhiB family transcriptional regulator, redox-sensing transcriptional regulator